MVQFSGCLKAAGDVKLKDKTPTWYTFLLWNFLTHVFAPLPFELDGTLWDIL